MPVGAEILDIQSQHDDMCIWAVVEPNKERETRGFFVVGTGHPLPPDAGDYLSSVQHRIGNTILVWHIFEEIVK